MRNHDACRGCFWCETCSDNRPCECYYPILEQYEDVVERIAEDRKRREYYQEYITYTEDWD